MDDALAMCQQAWHEGIRSIAALAHQNECWSEVTPDDIRRSVAEVQAELNAIDCPLELVPWSEVMVGPETLMQFDAGKLLTIDGAANQNAAGGSIATNSSGQNFMLIEQPHGLFLDIRPLISDLVGRAVTPVLAHADRYPELIGDQVLMRELVQLGCKIQLSTDGITDPSSRATGKVIKNWLTEGFVHVVGTDAHSPRSRRPRMLAAFTTVTKWAGELTANLIFCANGNALLRGTELKSPLPTKRKQWSFSRSAI
jgi:protein-tyrosine phosphatase